MTNIIYKIVSDFGECRKIRGTCADTARIEVEGTSDGFISIGELSCRLKDGVGRLPLGLLPDGEYSPLLFTEGGITHLEKIKKSERGISRSEPDTELISRMLLRLESCEKRILLLEERLSGIEAAITGSRLL